MGGTMTYTYLVDGTKVAAVVNLSAPASTPTDNAILEQNCYTPFGTRLQDSALKIQAANRWPTITSRCLRTSTAGMIR